MKTRSAIKKPLDLLEKYPDTHQIINDLSAN